MSVLILGAGGHGKVVADILLKQGLCIAGFLDDDLRTWGSYVLGIPVLGGIAQYTQYAPTGLILGIGSNQVRQQIVSRLGKAAEHLWINAVHPTVTIGTNVHFGQGIVAAAHVVINSDSYIGHHVIINTGSTVDHDCNLGDYCHIAPGVNLAGGVSIGTGAMVGIGSAVTPSRKIGDWAIVGAGATVIHDIPPRVTAMGTPARWSNLTNTRP